MKSSTDTNKKESYFLYRKHLAICLSSCYSVRIINREGVPESNQLNTSYDLY